MTPAVLLGSPSGDRVVIEVIGRMHPGARDFWDGNWLFSPVEVVVGGFRGRVPAGLRAEELRDFRIGLERAYAEFDGEVRLESMEEWLSLTVRVRRSGHVDIEGVAADRPGTGNRLSFRVEGMDQTDLPAVVGALAGIEERFPVLGSSVD